MTQTLTYKGGCHCGAVRYTIELPEIDKLFECNCSICSATGWKLVFAPKTTFRLLSGKDHLSDYQFGKKAIHHRFCRVCGVRSFAEGPGHDGADWVTINTRCLSDFDGSELPITAYDGASL